MTRGHGLDLALGCHLSTSGGYAAMGELLRRFVFSKYRAKVVVGVASKVVEVIFDLLTPIIVARMIDLGVAGHDTSVVVRLGLLLVVFAGIGYCFTLVCQKIAAIVSQGSGTDVRNALFEKVNALSSADVDEFGTPSLVTRITNDVNQVQVTVALGIRQLIRWPLLAVGSMVAALLIDLHLGLVFIVCTPVIALVFWVVMTRSVPYFQSMQSKLDRVSLVTREALSGIRVIRAFGRGRHEETRFRKAADDQTDTAIAVGKLSAILNPATFLVMNLGVVVILWVGGGRVNAGDLTQGEVVAFVNYMVLQDTWLFHGTIRENIAYGVPDASDEDVIDAAQRAHAHKFIVQLPQGYDTLIGEEGGSLSSGQRQLLCIARVMLTNPAVLLLDEATSSIDTRTELQVQDAFDRMMEGRTSLVVAHRLSTVRNADCILVMRDGRIIERGTHDELMGEGGFYASLYESQFEGTH